MVFSRTFEKAGFATFTLTRRFPAANLLELTFFRFAQATVRSVLLDFLTWPEWLHWCQSCIFSFIHGISVREVATPRVALPLGPRSDSGSPLSTSSSDTTDEL